MPDWNEEVRRVLPRLPGGRERDPEAVEEVAQHLASRYEDALAGGAAEPEAWAAALAELDAWVARQRPGGGSAPAGIGGRRGLASGLFADLRGDLRFGLRTLRRNPGFATVAVLTVSLAIGANTAVFSVVNAALLRPLPFRAPERLAALWESIPELGMEKMPFSAPDLDDAVRRQRSFTGLAAYQNREYDVSAGGEAERVTGARVSAALFPLLGVAPALGRAFTEEEDRHGAGVVVLSHGLWQRRFGSDPVILGKTVSVDRVPRAVVGVMPAGFRFPPAGPSFNGAPAEVFVPMAFTDYERQARGMMFNNSVVGRLHDGVSLEQARAEAELLGRQVLEAYPAQIRQAFRGATLRIGIAPLHEEIAGSSRRLLLVLQAAVGMVLLIACANVGNLLLSRAAARRDEMAIRAALGAGRSRLLRQTLAESLLLGLAGGGLGLVLARAFLAALPALAPPDLPFLGAARLDGTVLWTTLLIAVSSSALFGMAPAVHMSRGDLQSALRQGGRRTTTAGARRRLQDAFVVSQFALGLVLLVGAGLLVRSLVVLLRTDPGFQPRQAVALTASLPATGYPAASDVRSFYDRLLARLQGVPGVSAAGASSDLPLSGHEVRAFEPEGASLPAGSAPVVAQTWVMGDYFRAVGIPLRKGRLFDEHDRVGAPGVALVSESLARLCWPGADAVGKRMRWGAGNEWLEVVGVVGDVKDGPLHAAARPHTYTPFLQAQDDAVEDSVVSLLRNLSVVVRADADPSALLASVRREGRTLDPQLAVARVRPLAEDLRETVAPQRFNASLLAVFAGAAVLLAAIGVYGVLAESVAQRTHEIGIRMALGAGTKDLVRMVGRKGMALAALGLAVGLAAAVPLTRLMGGLLYGIGAADPATYATMPVLLGAVAAVACYLPARRATRVDPLVALRQD